MATKEKSNNKVKLYIPKAFRGIEAQFFGKYSVSPGMKVIEIERTYLEDFKRMGFKAEK